MRRSGVGGAGKLAFLPNYDYAVTPTIEITVSHATGGSKSLTIAEPAFFRTKGLLGLNSSPNVGDELTPYVASTYPPNRSVPLYRSEPVALAFTEDMSNLLPVDRVAAAGDPPEKAQLMQLALSVDRIASTNGALRLTSPGDDWLTANGGAVVVAGRPPFRNGLFSSLGVRKAASSDVQVLRFEAVLARPGARTRSVHSSQVLSHAPLAPDGTARQLAVAGVDAGERYVRRMAPTPSGPASSPTTSARSAISADAGASPVWSLTARHPRRTRARPPVRRVRRPDVEPLPGRRDDRSCWRHRWSRVGLSGTTPVQQAMLALSSPAGTWCWCAGSEAVDQEMGRAARCPVPARYSCT